MRKLILMASAAALLLTGCSTFEIVLKPKKKKICIPPTLPDIIGGYCPFEEKTVFIDIPHGKGTLLACEDYIIKKYINVSSGRPDGKHNTVLGEFRVQRKYKKYDSKKFPSKNGGRNMDWANFFYKGFAFHAGNIRGYSHGCVRLQRYDAEWMYNWVKIGTKVIVTDK